MMKIIWKKIEDEYLADIYYSLRMEDNEIAYLWYDYFSKKWFLSPTIYKDVISKKAYRDYGVTEEDIKELQFKAMLDLQVDLNKIVVECSNYSESISNLVSMYLKEEVCDADK